MDFTLNDFFLQQIPKLINIGAEHSDTRKCIWAAKQSGGTCRSSFKLCYLRSYCDEACGLAHSSHVWTVIMWCHSCAWSLHSGINQPWAAYRQINASAGGQDGAADWQLILSVSRKLRRNRTASLCKPSRWDFMTFLGMTLPTRCQHILRAYANPTLQVNVNFPGYVWSKEMTRFRACWKYDASHSDNWCERWRARCTLGGQQMMVSSLCTLTLWFETAAAGHSPRPQYHPFFFGKQEYWIMGSIPACLHLLHTKSSIKFLLQTDRGSRGNYALMVGFTMWIYTAIKRLIKCPFSPFPGNGAK